MRYGWLVGAMLFLAGSAVSGSAEAEQNDFRLTLIGSGNPIPEADRFGPATLVEAGDQNCCSMPDAAQPSGCGN